MVRVLLRRLDRMSTRHLPPRLRREDNSFDDDLLLAALLANAQTLEAFRPLLNRDRGVIHSVEVAPLLLDIAAILGVVQAFVLFVLSIQRLRLLRHLGAFDGCIGLL